MDDGHFADPVLELTRRIGDYPGDVLEFADVSNEEAELVLATLDEVEAETTASDITRRLRQQGHIL
jgi:recombinational DNA repair protein RecR